MSEDAVTLAYVHNGTDVAYSWHKCFVELLGYDMIHGGHVIRGGQLGTRFSHVITEARNKAVASWLDDEDPQHGEADWFFWIDTDMGFAPNTVDRLLAVADPVERPIVGGLAFTWSEELEDGMGGYRCEPRPTMFKWVPDLGTVCVRDFPANSLVDVAATGSACILIHRSVFETIRKERGDVWYDRIANPHLEGSPFFSEDISFCLRAASLGFPTFVHTGVRTTHLKHLWVSEADYWQSRPPPPALEDCTVVVPVLGRPQNAKPFMESLRASSGRVTKVLAMCSEPEDRDAWEVTGAQAVMVEEVSFACKVNKAIAHIHTPWFFVTGDDVRFGPGWLDHAEHVGNVQGVSVVGTNDLGNARVMAGEHGTHLLIRTDYVREQGGSWDGVPGQLCHEGYRHWYVDDEIVTVAKQRGEWAAALGSFVEHLHPAWGKAETDATYELGQSFEKKDKRLWQRRWEKYAMPNRRVRV